MEDRDLSVQRRIREALTLAIEKNDFSSIAITENALIGYQSEFSCSELEETTKSALKTAKSRLRRWSEGLTVGDRLDVFNSSYQTWYLGKITSLNENIMCVHYLGWDEKFDDCFSLQDAKIFPPNTITAPIKRGLKKVANELESNADDSVEEPKPELPPVADIVTSKSGRILKLKATFEKREPALKKARVVHEYEGREVGLDRSEWICSICGQLEAQDGSNLLLCDGECLRSFHTGCLGLDDDELGDDDWLCECCLQGVHPCFLCGETGKVNEEVHQCEFADCGKYYHVQCLQSNALHGILATEIRGSVSVKVSKASSISGKSSVAEGSPRKFSFKCPYHRCHNCFPLGIKRKDPIQRCFKCPVGYHANCIPPGARFSSIALLCNKHPCCPLPTQDRIIANSNSAENLQNKPKKSASTSSLQSADTTTVSTTSMPATSSQWKSYGAVLEEMVLPVGEPQAEKLMDDQHFRLPISVREDVMNQPKPYIPITRLVSDALPLREKSVPVYPPEEPCYCVSSCDDDCVNRISRVECDDRICNVKGDCGNRCFNAKYFPKTEVFREGAMGWGLRAAENISKRRIVIEYLGELIDANEMEKRMVNQRKYTPADHDFYIMEIDDGLFVDGKHQGNESRFVNHSCDPNCELQIWQIRGKKHIAITAIKNISAGEPLSYDYQFDTNEEDVFKCHCNTEACRGTMAPKKKADRDIRNLDRVEKARLIRLCRNKLRDQPLDVRRQEEWSRSCTGKNLPGDGVNEVRGGPISANVGASNDLFLPRNCRKGMEFVTRRRGMWLRQKLGNDFSIMGKSNGKST